MSFELRPSSNAVFAARLRSAEIRKRQELESAQRRPRASDKRKAVAMRGIESWLDEKELKEKMKEVWSD